MEAIREKKVQIVSRQPYNFQQTSAIYLPIAINVLPLGKCEVTDMLGIPALDSNYK